MKIPLSLHADRLFPADKTTRDIARRLYQEIRHLPIISPHGHTDPRWFADNLAFENPVSLLLQPDHYVLRMLYSLGLSMEQLGLGQAADRELDPEVIWQTFGDHYHGFRGTPSRLWLDHVFADVFGIDVVLNSDTAADYYQHMQGKLQSAAFLPRNLFERFNIEVLATTESPLDDLRHHQRIADSRLDGQSHHRLSARSSPRPRI